MKMVLHKKDKKFRFSNMKLFNFALLVVILCFFFVAIQTTANTNYEKEKLLLEDSLRKSAIHYYSLEGYYPESLQELLSHYHITYNSDKFVIEYIPQMSNLLPAITVIPIHQKN